MSSWHQQPQALALSSGPEHLCWAMFSSESGDMLTSALMGDTNAAQLRAVGPRPFCCRLSEAPLEAVRVALA